MARTIKTRISGDRADRLADILGGVWLVSLMMGLLHLPALVA